MSALAIPAPLSAPARQARPARPVRRRHLELVGPGFVPTTDERRAGDVTSRPAAAQPPLRLTARGRMVRSLTVLVLAMGIAVAAGGWLGSAVAGGSVYDGPTTTVSVAAGQSLWQIASASGAGQDVREVVSQIQQLNALPSASVTAGQQIVVPAG